MTNLQLPILPILPIELLYLIETFLYKDTKN